MSVSQSQAAGAKEPDIAIYARVMEEIKLRTVVVYSFLQGSSSAVYHITRIESIYLQIRMILELIALASLAANKSLFEENRRKFHKHWNPADILRDIEALNPGYYPKPVQEVACSEPGIKSELMLLTSGYLTREELVSFHGKTGNILHARNPFRDEIDYTDYIDQIPLVMDKIRALLNSHQVQLLGEQDFFYLVHMKEERDEHVHYYKFQRSERKSLDQSA